MRYLRKGLLIGKREEKKQKGRPQRRRPPAVGQLTPAHLWKKQSAAAGLETLGALDMQLGIAHLFTSVGTGESNLGNQCWQLHSAARTKQKFCVSLGKIKYMDSQSLEPWGFCE